MLTAKEVVWEIYNHENSDHVIIVRIDGKDHAITAVSSGYDGIIGRHVVIEAESLSKHV